MTPDNTLVLHRLNNWETICTWEEQVHSNLLVTCISWKVQRVFEQTPDAFKIPLSESMTAAVDITSEWINMYQNAIKAYLKNVLGVR